MAYSETLIAYCCYYRADDSRMTGKMEQFYIQALARYKDHKYPDFHKYIARKLGEWYKPFPFPAAKRQVESDCDEVV